jgi:short-subunit dehydrogenase
VKRRDSSGADGGAVLITGASEGIGRATAELFAARGHDLILLARTRERLQTLADSFAAKHGIECSPLVADVRDAVELQRLITAALDGRPLAAAVVNAGIGLYGPFLHTSWSDIELLLRTNFEGAIATARAVLPSLARGSSLVLLSSTIGKRAVPYNAVYCATKQGLLGFADALRLELRSRGVHVGVVSPARTDTPFFERMIYAVPQTRRRAVPTNPPARVARAILRCVRLRRREIVVSFPGKVFAFVGYHFPRLSDFLLYHNVPRPDDA